MNACEILLSHGVTRLCHFTKLQSLTHIISSEDGILATSGICQDTIVQNDKARYDGELDYVCCSVEYPNSWFLKHSRDNNPDKIFADWVVLYINPEILKIRQAKFCPCNASRSSGAYIQSDMDKVGTLFNASLKTYKYQRPGTMLSACPTDGQAEILVYKNIPLKYIIGIAVGNVDIAERVYAMLQMFGVCELSIWISPAVLSTEWSGMARNGKRAEEIRYRPEGGLNNGCYTK